MQMATVQAEHKKLEAMAGSWVSEEKMYPSPWDPKGGPATGRSEARMDLEGFFLILDYVQERNGKTSYRGHGVYGWDPQEKCYLMYWCDSMCPTLSTAKGKWEGNTLTFQSKNPMCHSRYIYEFEGDGRYTFRIQNSQDGKEWATFMEGRYSRKK